MRAKVAMLAVLAIACATPHVSANEGADPATPLVIGDTFTLTSKVLGESRRINVYTPPGLADPSAALPTLYMPDGGVSEDFLHVAGLVQIGAINGTMRPFRLVGIENTERRRDLTGPTENVEDKKIAPRVGGSAAFRKFLKDELMPVIRERYHTTRRDGDRRRIACRTLRRGDAAPRAGHVRHLHRNRPEPLVERREARTRRRDEPCESAGPQTDALSYQQQ